VNNSDGMKKTGLLLCLIYSISVSFSQAPATWTSADMYQGLQKLNVLGSVLYLAAHPDDENTRLIAWLSKDRLYRTGYLSMTRGDGGQNLIGDEQGVELGLIRTQELLSARRIDGGEQFFTRAFDFGFSKNPQETFTKWDKEKILSDVVWVIRKFQPDVIVTRFPTTGEGGHGHHTASAILANEAFTAAADPNRFPEQLKYVKPWQVKRVLWNSFNFGNPNAATGDLKIDLGGYNPLLGKSYGEIAAASRSNHKSQGFGAASSRGEAFDYFRTTSGPPASKDLMDDVIANWDRVPGSRNIQKQVDKLITSFDFLHPEKSVKGLVVLYKALQDMPDSYWVVQKRKETKILIEQCSGFFLDVITTEPFAVQSDSIRFNFSFNNRLGVAATLRKISIDNFDSSFSARLDRNVNFNFSKTLYVSPSKPITQPYWLANKMAPGYYNVSNPQQIGQADVDPGYVVNIIVNIEGEDISFEKPVKYRVTDPVKGEMYEPLVVLPAYTVEIPKEVNILRPNENWSQEFSYVAQKNLSNVKIYRQNDLLINDEAPLARNNRRSFYNLFDVTSKKTGISAADTFSFTYYEQPEKVTAKNLHTIRYDHIPFINYFTDAVNKYVILDVATYNKKIGYIVGAGDKVPEALEQMGYDVTLLTDKELSRNNLQQFDAIIVGVRAYNTNSWMSRYYDKLMKYVNEGGNFIVQYNTPNRNLPPIGPFKFDIVNRRVTDENAEVTILKPDHPVLNFPNKITQEDFKGWIQERSIYHAGNWDKSNFEPILSIHDPGENGDEGSLIIAPYGKGFFTYTGLVFFRELPAGVPGAYRLMANIIALNKKKAF